MSTIPREKQTAFQRWEMTSFGDERPSVVAQREAEQRARDAEQARINAERRVHEVIEAQQEQADVGPPVPPPVTYPTVEELEGIREEARASGYEEGLAAGHAEGHADGRKEALDAGKQATDEALVHVRALADSFGTALREADQLIANDVLELALHLAKGMLKSALPAKPELIIPIVREAIEYLPVLQQPALLVLHPDDADVVKAGIGDELTKGGWRVVIDPSVGRGGCKVDTASNQIDATAAARWERLTHALGKDISWLD